MIFSYNTAFSNFTLNNGFGRAGWGIINALKQLGHKVYYDADVAPVELTFAQPEYFKPKSRQYQIILCPWESTLLHEGWVDTFNSADETWATSEWVADVYRKAGVENVTTIYPHGIEKMYKPKLKRRQGPLRYFHQGGPANRKGAQEALDAFREVFKDDPRKATLTLKCYRRNDVRWFDSRGVHAPEELRNVDVVRSEFEPIELVNFTNQFNVGIYPSWGEGWGFIPMESMAQGTPTICTEAWAQYSPYLGDLKLKSALVDSPWPYEHPGQMYKPDMNDLVNKIQLSYDDYENQSQQFFKRSFKLHDEYNWLGLTEKAFAHIVSDQRFQ